HAKIKSHALPAGEQIEQTHPRDEECLDDNAPIGRAKGEMRSDRYIADGSYPAKRALLQWKVFMALMSAGSIIPPKKDKAAVASNFANSQDTTSTAKTNGLHTATAADSQSTTGTSPSHSHHHIAKHSLHTRFSSEKTASPTSTPTKSTKEPKSPSLARRNSWITSISSKFSSGSNLPATDSAPTHIAGEKATQSPPIEQPNPFGAAYTPGAKDIKGHDITSPPPPAASPRSGNPGFLQSALRRLSSSSGANMGKAGGKGGICARKVMNVDPHRDRCGIPDLEPSKLRRVAFCVDVEIAAPAKYVEGEDEPEPAPPQRRPSLTQLEHHLEAKRKRDQRLKKSEGEALKNPQTVAEDKDNLGVVRATGENLDRVTSPPERTTNGGQHTPSRKREKKKRSEEERKERKERKKAQALENGTKPVELARQDGSSSDTASLPTGTSPPIGTSPPNGGATKSTDRPTTDPLRIYRRCCQLRETPILKRITEQISSPSACPIATPGIISCLDLSGYGMQLPDIVTLGDYLAVVPVKKLMLEDCGLGDEAVRVILAGLLATKTPEQARHNRKLAKRCYPASKSKQEQLGVVEKLSLKNNAMISAEGWRHISFFINMSRSLKAIDLSGIPLPQPSATVINQADSRSTSQSAWDIPTLLQKSIAERLAGSHLEELVMGECALDTAMIEMIVEAVIRCKIRRLGLAHNSMTREGVQHVIRYLQNQDCEGLDLGGNDLRDHLQMLADVLDETKPLYALSLADCGLSPTSLSTLLPALVRLPNFRFIDLSHNRDLFSGPQNALGLLRKYLPQMPIIKRVHLMDVAMTPEHAIGLAEILPEIKTLAHLNILENHLLSPLASAKDEATQEEACALYASLMVAVRVSTSIVCIDVEVPTEDSSEVIKALAKQVVAYSLRNMERLPLTEGNETAVAALADPHGGEKYVTVPDVLLHIVGHMEGELQENDSVEPAPDDDYIVGGTGVVKALGICLNRAKEQRRSSRDMSPLTRTSSGTVTPTRKVLQEKEVNKGKAKEMSKNLLGSARKIRARLQPALVREARAGSSSMAYKRLQYLDSTLERMIQRFENEYPETRLNTTTPFGETVAVPHQPPYNDGPEAIHPEETLSPTTTRTHDLFDDDTTALKPALARAPSEHNLASRQAAEEGRMHRFGQRMRREVLPPDMLDYAHGTTGEGPEPEHLQELRKRLEALGGDEIQRRVAELGTEEAMREIGATKDALVELERRGQLGEAGEVVERLVRGDEGVGHGSAR
ncbi:MAG: hypothetical protein Q9184_003903, partial [Pyrenodesmia sp. 2 TL-2023]